MRVRPLLLVAATGALLLPAAANAAGQTPTAVGYSAADVPALATLPAGAAGGAPDGAAPAVRPSSGSGGAPAGSSPTVLPATAGACAPGARTTPASGSPTAAGYGAGVDPSVLGSQCVARTTDCAAAATTSGGGGRQLGAGSGGPGYMALRVYDGGSLSVLTLAPPAIVSTRAAHGTLIGTYSELLVWPNVAAVATPVSAGADRTRAACVPNPCLAASTRGNGGSPNPSDSADGSLVLRLPFGRGVAEALLGGLLLAASACGGAALVAGRRRRRRPAPNPLW